jgi:hypothetical protein
MTANGTAQAERYTPKTTSAALDGLLKLAVCALFFNHFINFWLNNPNTNRIKPYHKKFHPKLRWIKYCLAQNLPNNQYTRKRWW